MPFAYFGAKHGLARRYPPPAYGHIVEPFAGAAGYSVYWATAAHHVTLLDKDPAVVALWHRLQAMSLADLDAVEAQLYRSHTTDPLVAMLAGSSANVALHGVACAVTPRMVTCWPGLRRRLVLTLPRLRRWTVRQGDYTDAPDVRATWFVDPPYATGAADGYHHGAQALDYSALAQWCRRRQGQAVVCEQAPADWLPFRPLVRQQAYVTVGRRPGERTELVWTRTPGRVHGATPMANRLRAEAAARKAAVHA